MTQPAHDDKQNFEHRETETSKIVNPYDDKPYLKNHMMCDKCFAKSKKGEPIHHSPGCPHDDTPEPMTVEQIVEDYKSVAGWARLWSSDPEKNRDENWFIERVNSLIEQEKRAAVEYVKNALIEDYEDRIVAARIDELEHIQGNVYTTAGGHEFGEQLTDDRIAQLKKGTQ